MEENQGNGIKKHPIIEKIDLRTDRAAEKVKQQAGMRKERQSDRKEQFATCPGSGQQYSQNITKRMNELKENLSLPRIMKPSPSPQTSKLQLLNNSAIYPNRPPDPQSSTRHSYAPTLDPPSLSQKKHFIQRLSSILQQGTELQKSTSNIIKKAKKTGRALVRNYGRLCENSNLIVNGVEDYRLEEERNKKYKKEIRDMWMRYDK